VGTNRWCEGRIGSPTISAATHLHAIVFHVTYRSEPLRSALNDFRKFTGRQLSDDASSSGPACFAAAMCEASATDRERRFWQPSRHPEGIETEQFWQQKFDYLHDNPCRKGLVRRADHWRFSSALWYFSEGREKCDVPLSRIAW
jgi:hypothetical protein